MDLTAAYRYCERLTREEAKNFYYGIRLLPAPKRAAMSAIYSFARRVDDIADGDLPSEKKQADLDAARSSLDHLGPGHADPVLVALADTVCRYPVPQAALHELVDGMEMDLRATTYQTFDDLVVYCRKVAGAVGRLCLGVFGADDPAAATPKADALGVALQITNVLRDVAEDRDMGRVYLPSDDLERFGCDPTVPDFGGDYPGLIRFEAARGRGWFAEGVGLLAHLDRRSRACVSAMAGIYRRVLEGVDADPRAALSQRVSLPGRQKVWVGVRSLAGLAP